MMNQPIFDMRAIVAQEFATDDLSQGFMDRLMASLRNLPQASETELADEVLDRAAAYEDSQPSFAADLRAAVVTEAPELVA